MTDANPQTKDAGKTWEKRKETDAVTLHDMFINEMAFVTLLKLTDIPYYLLLAIILLAIAALTFVFSRYWAFRDKS